MRFSFVMILSLGAAALVTLCLSACGTKKELSSADLDWPSETDKRNPNCRDGARDRERTGTDCACCHKAQFAASGSLKPAFAEKVVEVVVSDSQGNVLSMAPNPYYNFFRHRPKLIPPLSARVVLRDGAIVTMKGGFENPSCNSCHKDGIAGPPG
jgi:cytochrome c5